MYNKISRDRTIRYEKRKIDARLAQSSLVFNKGERGCGGVGKLSLTRYAKHDNSFILLVDHEFPTTNWLKNVKHARVNKFGYTFCNDSPSAVNRRAASLHG